MTGPNGERAEIPEALPRCSKETVVGDAVLWQVANLGTSMDGASPTIDDFELRSGVLGVYSHIVRESGSQEAERPGAGATDWGFRQSGEDGLPFLKKGVDIYALREAHRVMHSDGSA